MSEDKLDAETMATASLLERQLGKYIEQLNRRALVSPSGNPSAEIRRRLARARQARDVVNQLVMRNDE